MKRPASGSFLYNPRDDGKISRLVTSGLELQIRLLSSSSRLDLLVFLFSVFPSLSRTVADARAKGSVTRALLALFRGSARITASHLRILRPRARCIYTVISDIISEAICAWGAGTSEQIIPLLVLPPLLLLLLRRSMWMHDVREVELALDSIFVYVVYTHI